MAMSTASAADEQELRDYIAWVSRTSGLPPEQIVVLGMGGHPVAWMTRAARTAERGAGVTTFEYARVPWEQVEARAAEGWRLMPIPPMPGMKNLGLGQVQMTGEVLFFMERETRRPAVVGGQNLLIEREG